MDNQGLCFRCEHRARFYETGFGPRCECQNEKMTSHSCYMYRPVLPVVLEKNENDKRPQFAGAMISARSHFVRVVETELAVQKVNDGSVLYYQPKLKIKQTKELKLARQTLRMIMNNEEIADATPAKIRNKINEWFSEYAKNKNLTIKQNINNGG